MKLLAGIAFVSLTACVNGQAKGDRLVVGTWRYDEKTLRVELSQQAKKEMARKGKQGATEFEAGKARLQDMFARLHLRFTADHRFALLGIRDSAIATGTWKLSGTSIETVADQKGLHLPDLVLAQAHGKMLATSVNPGLGTTRITLVRG